MIIWMSDEYFVSSMIKYAEKFVKIQSTKIRRDEDRLQATLQGGVYKVVFTIGIRRIQEGYILLTVATEWDIYWCKWSLLFNIANGQIQLSILFRDKLAFEFKMIASLKHAGSIYLSPCLPLSHYHHWPLSLSISRNKHWISYHAINLSLLNLNSDLKKKEYEQWKLLWGYSV